MSLQSHTSNARHRFDAILFDLGGTLIYFRGKWPDVFQQSNAEMLRALRAAGFSLDSEPFLADFHTRMRHYDAESGPDFIEYTTGYILKTVLGEHGYPGAPDSLLRQVLEARFAISQSSWEVEEDALPTLRALQQMGYRLGIVSNAGDDADVQALVDKASVREFFEVIVTSAAQGIRKPNPRIFLDILARLGVEPGRAAMVGDTLGADILGARNAGITSVWITRRADVPANRAHQDTIQPDASIGSLSELPGLLEKLP
jgi:HAD superfamily hydrolase (TIGR01662 family)